MHNISHYRTVTGRSNRSSAAGIKMRLSPAPQTKRWRTESDDDAVGH